MTLASQTARWAIPCLALATLAEGAAAQQRRGGGGGAVTAGTYLVKLTVGDQEQTATVRVLEDIWAGK